jgi:hypothetical protein
MCPFIQLPVHTLSENTSIILRANFLLSGYDTFRRRVFTVRKDNISQFETVLIVYLPVFKFLPQGIIRLWESDYV